MQDDFIAMQLGAEPIQTEPVKTEPTGTRRTGRGRTLVLVGAAAGVLTLGGGAVAFAANSSSTPPVAGYGQGPEGGRAGGGAPDSQTAPVHTPHLDGTVSSVSGSTVLITDRDGFTRTIKLSSATKYTDSLTAAKLIKGTRIHAEGAVDSDKTSLDATTVGTMPTGGPGRAGPGHGGPGQGGPGGGGPGRGGPVAPKPSGSSSSGSVAPTPAPSSTSS